MQDPLQVTQKQCKLYIKIKLLFVKYWLLSFKRFIVITYKCMYKIEIIPILVYYILIIEIVF